MNQFLNMDKVNNIQCTKYLSFFTKWLIAYVWIWAFLNRIPQDTSFPLKLIFRNICIPHLVTPYIWTYILNIAKAQINIFKISTDEIHQLLCHIILLGSMNPRHCIKVQIHDGIKLPPPTHSLAQHQSEIEKSIPHKICN